MWYYRINWIFTIVKKWFSIAICYLCDVSHCTLIMFKSCFVFVLFFANCFFIEKIDVFVFQWMGLIITNYYYDFLYHIFDAKTKHKLKHTWIFKSVNMSHNANCNFWFMHMDGTFYWNLEIKYLMNCDNGFNNSTDKNLKCEQCFFDHSISRAHYQF